METIALTNWNGIISPLFDASCSLLIIKPGEACIEVDISKFSLLDKAELCSKEGVNVLICGAISRMGHAMLCDKGIRVFAWIRGPVDKVITAYNNNLELIENFSMPGFKRRGCRRRGCFYNNHD